jgi:TRAP-type C4-dicarboxylate transport system substrate-binding protein
MKNLKLTILFLAVCLIGLSAQSAAAQVTGGYGPVAKSDPQVRAAAKFAIAAECKRTKRTITLISTSKAAQQVVAGMNYKVCLKVRDGGQVRTATAVVYRTLQGGRSLTSWDWGTCDW